jgi:uncharacterized membrane protein
MQKLFIAIVAYLAIEIAKKEAACTSDQRAQAAAFLIIAALEALAMSLLYHRAQKKASRAASL